MTTRYTSRRNYKPLVIGQEAICLQEQPQWVPCPSPNNPIWKRILQTFDTEHFLYPAPPVDLGLVDLDVSPLQGLRVLRCPLKKPGTDCLQLPTELAPLEPLVRHMLETELFVNPDFNDFWAHISFECTEEKAGETQRVAGWHVDGFQGVRVPTHQIEHSYLWATEQAIDACVQPFYLSHLDRSRHNIFDELEKQAVEANAVAGRAQHVYLIDPYLVHRSPVLKKDGWRAFCRVTFTSTELEDPVNTVNQALELPQAYASRIDARNRLSPYDGPIPWESYGLKGRAEL